MKTCAAIVVAAAAAHASAATVDFSAYTNNSGNTAGIATSATLSADASTFSLTLTNTSALGFIGSFYIEAGDALSGVDAGSVDIGNGGGVNFKLANGNWNGPGGTAWGSSFLEIKKHGGASNGIQSGESLTLTFDHDGSFDLGSLIDAINAEEIRFAIHYQAWTGGKSEKLLNDRIVVVPLPPAAWAGLGTIALIAGARGARRRGR
jgi:opacity protein-like surface antigen